MKNTARTSSWLIVNSTHYLTRQTKYRKYHSNSIQYTACNSSHC